MSELNVLVCDERQSIHQCVQQEFGQAIVAALSADPTTIDELAAAMGRFRRVDADQRLFGGWATSDFSTASQDRGVCIVDLNARLVVCHSSEFAPSAVGQIRYHHGQNPTDVRLGYHISDEWQFVSDRNAWPLHAESRRAARSEFPPLDVRELLYGRLCEYLFTECLVARGCGKSDPIVTIHKDWLVTSREELRGKSPRDLLLGDLEHLTRDMYDREMQWSHLGECPPGIATTSAAFQFGGVGPHERVLYYDLVRYLLEECWQMVSHNPTVTEASLYDWLEELRRAWLLEADPDLHGESPTAVMLKERRRLPFVVSGEAAMVDHDCPLCQMMAEDLGPCFWHLDDCYMEDEFEFSRYVTFGQWQQEQAKWAEMNRCFDQGCEPSGPARSCDESPSPSSLLGPPDVWSDVGPGDHEGESPLGVVLFNLGARLAELDLDLKIRKDTESFVTLLNRDFGNLRESVANSADLVAPVVENFCEHLYEATEMRPDLTERCTDFEVCLRRFADRVAKAAQSDDRRLLE